MNNAFLLIGSASSGKTTFLAVAYYLIQSDIINNKILLESDNDDTAKILFQWESSLNNGSFPERTKVTNDNLDLSLWLDPKNKIKIYNIDVSGELFNKFNPLRNKTGLDNEEKINSIIEKSLVHVIIIDSTSIKDEEDLRYHDFFYNNIITNIKKICNYQFDNHTPLMIVFTKIDQLNIDDFNPEIFAKRYYPKTYKQYKYFFKGQQRKRNMLFGCSIGEVNSGSNTILKFNPIGYKKVMESIIQILLRKTK